MRKIKECIKCAVSKEFLPLWIFAGIQLVYHLIMREADGSDAMWFFRNQLDAYTLEDYLTARYENWSSRLLIEAVLVYISRNIVLWKIVDWLFWVFLAWSLIWLFPKEKREFAAYGIVGFLLIYPLWDLETAGWIATSVNYTWPLALGIFSLHGTVRVFYGQKTPFYLWILYTAAAVFGANMEQMSAVLLTVNVCAAVYFILEKKEIRLYLGTIAGLAVSGAEMLFILMCPGNAARKHQEIIDWMPNFNAYNLLDKISMGFTDTMHHLFASQNLMFLCFAILLAVLVFLKSKKTVYRFAAAFPVVLNVVLVGFWNMLEKYFPEFSKLMEDSDFICSSNYQHAANYIPTVLYLAAAGCILVSLVCVCETYFELAAQAVLLALGLATRIVMGFTPTIYVSQERTFLYLYMILGISAVFLLQNNRSLLCGHRKICSAMKLSGMILAAAFVVITLSVIGGV